MATRTTKPRPTPQQLAFAVAAGHLDGNTHTGRTAKARTCTTCRRRVLTGDDSHLAALTVTVDPDPLTLAEEALALATGRNTYTLRARGGKVEISHRRMRRAAFPAPITDPCEYETSPGYTVHAEHECNARKRHQRMKERAARMQQRQQAETQSEERGPATFGVVPARSSAGEQR